MTLPGGTKYRKSTSYSHCSLELGNFGPAKVSGFKFGGNTYANLRFVDDEGRESGSIGSIFTPAVGGSRNFPNIPFDARNETATKVLNKISDQKVNIGENLATLSQTANLLVNKGNTILDVLNSVRHKEFGVYLRRSYRDLVRKGSGVPELVAKNYLEYIYGLKPLVEDHFMIAKLLQEQVNETLLLYAESTANRTVKLSRGNPVGLSYSKITRLEQSADAKVKTVLAARIDPNWSGARTLNQFGLLNPFGLAWDLVPYSFVVDWFLPFGPVLYALSAPAGLVFVDGCVSMKTSDSGLFEYKPSDTTTGQIDILTSEQPSVIPTSYEGYRRDILTSWPVPGLWFDPDPLRGSRKFKAFALALLQFSRTRPDVR